MLFMSSGMIIEESHCSICGQEYGDCTHLTGKAYMGEICQRIIKKCTPLEVSIVDHPADKRCYAEKISHKGKMRDVLTWREQPNSNCKNEHGKYLEGSFITF
jgi:hypothetical protein